MFKLHLAGGCRLTEHPHLEEEVPNLILLGTSFLKDSTAVLRQVHFVCGPRHRSMRVRVMAEEAGYSNSSGVLG